MKKALVLTLLVPLIYLLHINSQKPPSKEVQNNQLSTCSSQREEQGSMNVIISHISPLEGGKRLITFRSLNGCTVTSLMSRREMSDKGVPDSLFFPNGNRVALKIVGKREQDFFQVKQATPIEMPVNMTVINPTIRKTFYIGKRSKQWSEGGKDLLLKVINPDTGGVMTLKANRKWDKELKQSGWYLISFDPQMKVNNIYKGEPQTVSRGWKKRMLTY